MKLINAIRNTRRYNRASKLMNAGKLDEALEALSKFDAAGDYVGKKLLFQADILHRKGDLDEAVSKYLSFINEFSNSISFSADRIYLKCYAEYFCDQARIASGDIATYSVSKSNLSELNKKASLLCRAEFPY